jgi:hypothetical protein
LHFKTHLPRRRIGPNIEAEGLQTLAEDPESLEDLPNCRIHRLEGRNRKVAPILVLDLADSNSLQLKNYLEYPREERHYFLFDARQFHVKLFQGYFLWQKITEI